MKRICYTGEETGTGFQGEIFEARERGKGFCRGYGLRGIGEKINKAAKGLFCDESGQAAAMLAVALAVILGCGALAVDLGADYRTSIKMQNAADMAALAAARCLPDAEDAKNTAIVTAMENGAKEDEIVVETPCNGDASKVKVICTRKTVHGLAKIFSSEGETISKYSVACVQAPKWAGAALPLLNVDIYGIGENLTIWEKNSPGNFGVLYRKKMTWVPENGATPGHYEIEYSDGVYVENGKVATLKRNIEEMCREGRTVYLFSLSNEAIEDESVDLDQGTLVDKSRLVLLQCTVSTFDSKTLRVSVDAICDIYGNFGDAQMPEDYMFVSEGCSSTLVE